MFQPSQRCLPPRKPSPAAAAPPPPSPPEGESLWRGPVDKLTMGLCRSPFTILCHAEISPGGGNTLADCMEVGKPEKGGSDQPSDGAGAQKSPRPGNPQQRCQALVTALSGMAQNWNSLSGTPRHREPGAVTESEVSMYLLKGEKVCVDQENDISINT